MRLSTPLQNAVTLLLTSNFHLPPSLQSSPANVVRYGQSLLTFDPKAEARVRLKIDLYIIPTVAILYLFCFIDRANIGRSRRHFPQAQS